MRPELKNELKPRFFGQYLGQQSTLGPIIGIKGNFSFYTGDTTNGIERWWKLSQAAIILRLLSSITDEEAIEIAKYLNLIDAKHVLRSKEGHFISISTSISRTLPAYRKGESIFLEEGKLVYDNGKHYDANVNFTITPVDELRSRGFALPFHGYSVEELIEAGWIKLQEG